MCVAIPSKVVEIEDQVATVELGGNRSTARLDLLDDVKVGDYVLVHAGFAITTVDEEYAKETLAMLSEVGML
ncbi:MAG: HypC/HybG/HupF family hydrogenase formation chaperone [candidate division WS1 bacterium]|jgi:hydrogenase expression/formation protein HypC|nr:HypC/HybG/HupF family hydrogenase formation chaperone [candidate division WS1 bacterium]